MSTSFKTNVQDATINNALTVDTNTLYVDPINNGVCVGTTTLTSGYKLTVAGKSDFSDILGLAKIATGSLPSAASYEGHIVYDDTLNKFVYSNGSSWVDPSSGSVSIGSTVTSGTTGSILFVGSGPVLAQDNANLFWDDTNNRLGIGQASPASPLDILPITVTTQATGYISGIKLGGTYTKNDSNTRQFYVEQIKPTFNLGGSNSNTTVDILNVDSTNTAVTGTTINLISGSYGGTKVFNVDSAGYTINGGTRMVGEGNQIWKDSSPTKAVHQGMKVPGGALTDDYIFSTNNGVSWTERLRIASSSGLATFANGLAVDTDSLYVDSTNHRVGIGTTSPSRALSVVDSVASTGLVYIRNNSTSGYSETGWFDSAGTKYVGIGRGNSGTIAPFTNQPYITWTETLQFVASFTTSVATLTQAGLFTPAAGIDLNAAAAELKLGGSAGTSGQVLTSAGSGARPTWTTPASFTMSIGGTVTSGTTGSILFVGSGPVLAQDNANLFWDNTNDRLGIGTASPSYTLDLKRSVASAVMGRVQNDSSTGYSGLIFNDHSSTYQGFVGWGNTGSTSPALAGKFGLNTAVGDLVFAAADSQKMAMSQAGQLSFTPTAVTTAADQYISGISLGGSYTKNDTNTRQFYVEQIKPTFNFGGSNTNTTVDILSVDSTNTSTTGLTANLANLKYGGTSKFKVDSAGLVTASNRITTVTDPTSAQDAATKNYVDTNAGPTVLSFGATSTANTDITEYILPTYGQAASATEIGIIIPNAGKISKLYIKAGTGPTGDSIVFTVRKNGSAQAVTATLAAAATTANDTSNSFTVVAGDEVSIEANPGASISAGAANLRIGLQYTIG